MARRTWSRRVALLAVTFVAGCTGSFPEPNGESVPGSHASQPSRAESPSPSPRATPSATPLETAVSSSLPSTFQAGRGVLGLVEVGGSVWAAAYWDGALVRIDPLTRSVTGKVVVGVGAIGVA